MRSGRTRPSRLAGVALAMVVAAGTLLLPPAAGAQATSDGNDQDPFAPTASPAPAAPAVPSPRPAAAVPTPAAAAAAIPGAAGITAGLRPAFALPGDAASPPADGAATEPAPDTLSPPAAATPAPAAEPAPPAAAAPPAPARTAQPAPPPAEPATTLAQPAIPPPEPVTVDHPTAVDTATLAGSGQTFRLFGLVGTGGDAVAGLQGYITANGDKVTCQAEAGGGFVCLLPDGTDIAQVALVNGAARTQPDAPEAYRAQEAQAQAERRGVWASLPPPPVTLQHPTVQDTGTLLADGKTFLLDGVDGVGAPYAGQLQGYIVANGDALQCQPQGAAEHYVCLLPNGTDIAKVVLVNGAARVAADAPDSYRIQQSEGIANRRGIWVSAAINASAPPPPPPGPAAAAMPPATDGVSYVGGAPTAMIDGAAVFFVWGGDDGWGYWDHGHHWHHAPDRYARHLDRYHPGGAGLRHGYGATHEAALHREMPGHAGMAPHPGAAPHAGMAGGAFHSASAGGFVRPTAMGGMGHAAPAAHPAAKCKGPHC